MISRMIVVAAVAGLAGFAGGEHYAASPEPVEVSRVEVSDDGGVATDALALQLDEQSRLLRKLDGRIETLAGSVAASGEAVGRQSDSNVKPTDLPESDPAAHRDAVNRLNTALGSGVWRGEDRDALRELLPRLTSEEQEAIVRELIVALNKGSVRVEFQGAPF